MRGQLKDQMDLLFVIKEPKHFEYIRVIQICLYFDLLLQLFLHATFDQILFVYLLDRHKHIRGFMSNHTPKA